MAGLVRVACLVRVSPGLHDTYTQSEFTSSVMQCC